MNDEREFRIPVGPQHPALKEPAGFSLALKGEKILGAEIRLGYNHRGIEKGCEGRSYIQALYLVERICGICSHSHATVFAQTVEEIAGVEVPARAKYLRVIVGELERIHSHLLWLGVAGHEIGFDTLLMYTWRDREVVMDLLAEISGNRVNYGMNTIGGVRRDISPELAAKILSGMDVIEERTKYYLEVAAEEETLKDRLAGVGVVPRDVAEELGAVGPTARASGVARDIRKDDPYAAYGDLSFEVVTDDHCDVYGRTVVRIKEVLEACRIIRRALKELPDGPLAVRAPRKIPAGEAVGRYEAPRGELLHYIRADGTEKPDRVKVRTPTLANIQSVKYMLRDRFLADMPIVVAAIDPCFSCTDRTVELREGRHTRVQTWEEMRLAGIEWYRRLGVDFEPASRKLARRIDG